jgi:Zn-dependent M28 family amino/carboxypeptidase
VELQQFSNMGHPLVNVIGKRIYKNAPEVPWIIIGAHYDSRPTTPTLDRSMLQGTNDNASGVGLLMELAQAVNSLPTEHTIKFIAFGAEEVGLKGSAYYANNMTKSEINKTLFMTNFDSIVFGDFMYFHAGTPAAADVLPEWGFARDMALDIANDLGIEVYTNPGLNPHYPAGTGCCSDQVSFEQLMPILVGESTNWNIGELDGYTQTTSPLVPEGATWHDPTYDSLEFISANFSEWLEERPRDYSMIMQTLLVEANNLNAPVQQQTPEPRTILALGVVIALASTQRKKIKH